MSEPETIQIVMEGVKTISENPVVEKSPREQRLDKITNMIKDPIKPVADINRLIAAEHASITAEIAGLTKSNGYKLKFLTEQVKALRELAKSLAENEVLAKKDILNFDGPKFQYVYNEVVSTFRKSLKESGLQESQVNEVLRNFRDFMSLKELELRKQTEKIDSSFVKK